MILYLDACCLNRPFDNQTQIRIRLESEAITLILGKIENEDWLWVNSEVVNIEIAKTPDSERRRRLENLTKATNCFSLLTDKDVLRGKELATFGFSSFDALHLAIAERECVDVFLTTDDKLLKRARHLISQLNIQVENPLTWLLDIQEL